MLHLEWSHFRRISPSMKVPDWTMERLPLYALLLRGNLGIVQCEQTLFASFRTAKVLQEKSLRSMTMQLVHHGSKFFWKWNRNRRIVVDLSWTPFLCHDNWNSSNWSHYLPLVVEACWKFTWRHMRLPRFPLYTRCCKNAHKHVKTIGELLHFYFGCVYLYFSLLINKKIALCDVLWENHLLKNAPKESKTATLSWTIKCIWLLQCMRATEVT